MAWATTLLSTKNASEIIVRLRHFAFSTRACEYTILYYLKDAFMTTETTIKTEDSRLWDNGAEAIDLCSPETQLTKDNLRDALLFSVFEFGLSAYDEECDAGQLLRNGTGEKDFLRLGPLCRNAAGKLVELAVDPPIARHYNAQIEMCSLFCRFANRQIRVRRKALQQALTENPDNGFCETFCNQQIRNITSLAMVLYKIQHFRTNVLMPQYNVVSGPEEEVVPKDEFQNSFQTAAAPGSQACSTAKGLPNQGARSSLTDEVESR